MKRLNVRHLVTEFVVLFAVAFAILAMSINRRIVYASTHTIPLSIHMQTGTTCPAGAYNCALLTWVQPAADATHGPAAGYKIYRSVQSGGCANVSAATCTNVGTVTSATSTTFVDSPLQPVTTYFWVATATNSGGESGPSNEVSGTTKQVPAPNPPANFNAVVQ